MALYRIDALKRRCLALVIQLIFAEELPEELVVPRGIAGAPSSFRAA
ncbi:MAG: hypothetical protein ACYCZX_08035 [Rhodospirillaceae bacterium]